MNDTDYCRYSVFAAYMAKWPSATPTETLADVMKALNGRGDPNQIVEWHVQWRIVRLFLQNPDQRVFTDVGTLMEKLFPPSPVPVENPLF